MNGAQDLIVFIIVVLVVVVWGAYRFKNWLNRPWAVTLPYTDGADKPKAALAAFMEEKGYTMVCGKYKIPLRMKVDNKKLQSRIFIDGVARDETGIYVIKAAKDRQSVEWTGSGVRDRFLPFYILHHKLSGILYVDLDLDQMKKITFDWDEEG